MQRDIVVIGASAGGVMALQRLASLLPSDFAAAILIVLHLSPDSSGILPEILASAGPLPASNAEHGADIRMGRIYVAPPNRHLLVSKSGRIHLGHGPKENRFRPAVDPLFRSAAHSYGPRVAGIVLSGGLDDGTAGLCAIKSAGGLAIVQDPREAELSSMPLSAIRHVAVDHVIGIEEMAALLPSLLTQPVEQAARGSGPMQDKAQIEIEVASNDKRHPGILNLGAPSIFTCPECHGALLRVQNSVPIRFRCHTGHAYTGVSLENELKEKVETSAWNTIRSLQEHAMLLQELCAQPGTSQAEAADYLTRAEDALARAKLVRETLTAREADPSD